MIRASSRKRKLPSRFVNNQASGKHCKSTTRKTTSQNDQGGVQEQDPVSENTDLNNDTGDSTETSIPDNVDLRSLANIVQNMATQQTQMSSQIAAIISTLSTARNLPVVDGTCHTTQQAGQCDAVSNDIIHHSETTHRVPDESSRDADLTATLSLLQESQPRAGTCLPHPTQEESNVHGRAGTCLPRQFNENTDSCIRVGTSLSGNQQIQIGDSSRYANQQIRSTYTSGAGTSLPATTNQHTGNSSLFPTDSAGTGTCLPVSTNLQGGISSLYTATSSGVGTGLPLSNSILTKNLDESNEFSQLSLTIGTPSHKPVFSSGLPIGTSVKDTLKQKIWAHKFVDLYDILYPSQSTSYTLGILDHSNQPHLNLTPNKKRTLSEREWSQAFDIFLAVYIQKYPNEITDLLSYSQHIKDLMRHNVNWQYYDRQFRLDREHSVCSWSNVRQDLELRAFRNNPKQSFSSNQPFRSAGSQSKIPPGYCFKYHKQGVRCETQNCRYKHQCPKCSRPHPTYLQCHSKAEQNQTSHQTAASDLKTTKPYNNR